MSSFPVYTVRGSDGKPCGHQHRTEDRADNCAKNQAYSRPGKTFTVLRWHGDEDGHPVVVSHFEAKKAEVQNA